MPAAVTYRLLALVLAGFVLGVSAAFGVEFALGDAQRSGDSLLVPVTLQPGSGESPAGLQFDFVYDPAQLALADVVAGSAAESAGKTVFFEEQGPGRARIIVAGVNLDGMAAGTVATAVLVPAQRNTNGATPTLESIVVSDPQGRPMDVQYDAPVAVDESPNAEPEARSAVHPSADSAGNAPVVTGSAGLSSRRDSATGAGLPHASGGLFLPDGMGEEAVSGSAADRISGGVFARGRAAPDNPARIASRPPTGAQPVTRPIGPTPGRGPVARPRTSEGPAPARMGPPDASAQAREQLAMRLPAPGALLGVPGVTGGAVRPEGSLVPPAVPAASERRGAVVVCTLATAISLAILLWAHTGAGKRKSRGRLHR